MDELVEAPSTGVSAMLVEDVQSDHVSESYDVGAACELLAETTASTTALLVVRASDMLGVIAALMTELVGIASELVDASSTIKLVEGLVSAQSDQVVSLPY